MAAIMPAAGNKDGKIARTTMGQAGIDIPT